MWGIRAFAVCLALVGACSKEQPAQQGDSGAQIDATPAAATTTASAEHARAATSTVDANRIVNADKEPATG
jgi:hypothetical protein